jgi:hypothetical protein
MIKDKIKKFIGYCLSKKGLFIAQSTTADEVNALVKLLRPIDSGIGLVRVGGDNDGGYLMPDDFDGVAYCFSPGVGKVATFEQDCISRGIPCFLADWSVDSPPPYLRGYSFLKKFVGAYNDDRTITIDDWVNTCLPNDFKDDLILQMDISGAEFETILAISINTLKRFRIIVVEFHNSEALRSRAFYKIYYSAVKKLRSEFESVHVHPNNCCVIADIAGAKIPRVFEVTFLRKDRVKQRKRITSLPHPLDQRNVLRKDDIRLPDNWLKYDDL